MVRNPQAEDIAVEEASTDRLANSRILLPTLPRSCGAAQCRN